MRRMLTLAAVAALAAAPAFAQNPPVRSRTEVQAPTTGQAGGRVVAGQNAAQPAVGQPIGNRPVAGQSVAEPAVGQARNQVIVGRSRTTGAHATGVNDALFAAAAADSGLSELTLSQLGAQRATDPELRRFSERMLGEHTRLSNELRTLTAQKR